MDTIDVKLIRELAQGRGGNVFRREVRLSYEALSKRLGIPQTTVLTRVKRILKSGYLSGWTLLVNPSLLAADLFTMGFDVPSSISKDDLIDRLRLLPDVLAIINYQGSHIAIVFYYLDELDLSRKTRLTSKLCAAQSLFETRIPFPACNISLSRTDWMIIASLQANIGRSFVQIAKDIRLSSRTVKRRLTRMLAHQAIFMLASVDPGKLVGALLADFIVSYENTGRTENESKVISGLLDGYLIVSGVWPNFSVYNTIVPNLPSARKLHDDIKRHAGVKSVRLELVAERIEQYEILAEQVNRKLTQTKLSEPRTRTEAEIVETV